jgi:hypothetical protein
MTTDVAPQDRPSVYFDEDAEVWVMTVRRWTRPVEINGECIEWLTNRTKMGYPKIGVTKRREEYVHRMVAEDMYGDIEGKVVMHSCDNPPCVNPNHLIVGTQSENMLDAAVKGRIRSPFFADGHPQRVGPPGHWTTRQA